MKFNTRERRVWIRTDNHAVVWDRDPAFGRFCRDPRGKIMRIVQFWLAGKGEDRAVPRAYIGAVRLGSNWPRRDELCRFLRRAGATAHLAGEPPRTLRRQLINLLREEMRSLRR